MNEINEVWYTVTYWDKSVVETMDAEEARLAIREGREVLKTTRKFFESGPAIVRLAVTVEIKKVKDV